MAEGKSKHFWTQRAFESKGEDAQLRSLQLENDQTKSQLNEAQRSLDVARREIEELKQQATDNSKSQQRVSSISGGGALNSVQLKELTGLGEKCMDLTQQNEVLGQEVARLHRDAQERDRGFEELGHARSEIERLRAEAKKSQNR